MSIDFRIGNQIKEIRVAKHISQSQLCDDICNINTLVRIEANKQSPSFELVVALANRLGITVDKLIAKANYEEHAFYYSLKDTMEETNAGAHWNKLKEQVELISKELYQSLPLSEQQYIDIMRIEVAKFVDKDFDLAYRLAKSSLEKTFDIRSTEYYSREEMRLLNVILQFDQSVEHLALTKRALEWAENQPESLKDYYACMLLLTGLMITSYMNDDWSTALHYAMRGYKIAIKKNGFKFVPNFLFAQGMCLYQLNTELEKARSDMKAALQFCNQFDMLELYQVLIRDVEIYDIKLEMDS